MNINFSAKATNSVGSILAKSLTEYKYEHTSVSNSIFSEYAESKITNCKRITNSAWIEGVLHQMGLSGLAPKKVKHPPLLLRKTSDSCRNYL